MWDVDTQKIRNRLEEHSLIITDVRFAATSNRLATSSFDKTVRVWDADSVSLSTAGQSAVTAGLQSQEKIHICFELLLTLPLFLKPTSLSVRGVTVSEAPELIPGVGERDMYLPLSDSC